MRDFLTGLVDIKKDRAAWEWPKLLTLLAILTIGTGLSFAAYEASRSWIWAGIGLGTTAILLVAFGLSFRETVRAERHAAERFRAVIDNAHDAIIAINSLGRIEMFNRAAERIFGFQATEVVGQNVNMLMPAPYHDEHDGYIKNYITTGTAKIIGTGREVEAQHKDGTIFPIDLSIGEMRSGNNRGFIGVIRDTTERHQSERRVRELTAELVHISRLSAMGQLSSSLAHELNQPLTAIANYAEVARQIAEMGDGNSPKLKEFLGKTVEQADRAGQIIRRLRSFVEKGSTERHPEELNRIVTEATNLATIGVRVDGIRVEFDLAEALPAISMDKIQIQQVIVNLVRNAIEALRDAKRRELTVQTLASAGSQEVVIRDTGHGIHSSVAEKLFTPFMTTKKDGMGIGLSISQSIIESHEGRLWAEPNPGGGTIFRFRLPAGGAGGADA